MTRLRRDTEISRRSLTAIAIPSLRSLQIRVVPPKQTPQNEGFVFYQYNMDSPSDAIAPGYFVSRRSLTAIAIPSLRSLQIWVVPPKHAPRIGECVFLRYIRILPSDAIAPRYGSIPAFPNGNRYSVAALCRAPYESLAFRQRCELRLEAIQKRACMRDRKIKRQFKYLRFDIWGKLLI